MERPTAILLTLLLSCLLASCTIVKTSNVMVGEKRASIAASQVKLYTTPPAKYVEIALLSVDAGHDFRSAQDLMDTAIERLKADAASMGANGVLLNNVGDKVTGNAVGIITRPTTPGTPAIAAMRSQSYKTVSGTAIYVEQ
jgi:uncharacterized protein YbjQ (UPF0145 family)